MNTVCKYDPRLARLKSGEITYSAPWTRKLKPFKLAKLEPRMDKDSKVTFDRLEKDIQTEQEKHQRAMPAKGTQVTPGWMLVATDGHRALLEPVIGKTVMDGRQAIQTLGALSDGYNLMTIQDPEFHLAVKRARVMADKRSDMVKLTAVLNTLTIASEDSEYGTFEETLDVAGATNWARVALNVDYLELICGSWPLCVWTRTPDEPVIVEPWDHSWRLVVMPMLAIWKEGNHATNET